MLQSRDAIILRLCADLDEAKWRVNQGNWSDVGSSVSPSLHFLQGKGWWPDWCLSSQISLCVHGAGGAPRQARVLLAGRGAPAGIHSCRQEWTAIPAGRKPFLPAVCLTPVHGAGGAPRQALVLLAGRGAPCPFLPAVCLTPIPAGSMFDTHSCRQYV